MRTISMDDVLSVDPEKPQAAPPTAAPAAAPSVQDKLAAAAVRHGVPPDLLSRVARQESGGAQSAVSPKGAIGVMQLMPGTAAGLGVDPNNEDQNIEGGAKYLGQLLKKYNGDQRLALAAYNAGPGTVDRAGGVPPYPETQNYVKAITGAPPVLLAQDRTPPPPQGLFSSAPTRATAVPPQNVQIKYDPAYDDPAERQRAMSEIRIFQAKHLADVSTPEDYTPIGGGPKITAVYVNSAVPEHNGLWTTGGRKIADPENWVRAGVGAGPGGSTLKNLTVHSVVDSKTGRVFMANHDPTTGEMNEIPGLEPQNAGGLHHMYLYNRTKGTTGYYSESHLKPDEATGLMSNRSGDVLEPAFTPQEIVREREKAANQKDADYAKLRSQLENWKGQIDRGELGAKRTSFGIPLPWDYGTDKAAYYKKLNEFDQTEQAAIQKRYQEREAFIQRDLEHRTPAGAAPAGAAQPAPGAAPAAPKKEIVKGGVL